MAILAMVNFALLIANFLLVRRGAGKPGAIAEETDLPAASVRQPQL
jgi:hypothetical protein